MGDLRPEMSAVGLRYEDDETTPLLVGQPAQPVATAIAGRDGLRYRRPFMTVMLYVFIVLLEFGNTISLPAQTQIFQDLICNQYYTSLNGTAPDCKSPPVQAELGYLIGVKESLEQVPGIALAVPFGMLADSWGRRPVMLLATLSIVVVEVSVRLICIFSDVVPLRAIWFTPIFYFMGGGSTTASSMVFTIIADIYSSAERTSIFFILFATVLISEVFGAPLGAALAENLDPWIPYLTGPLIMFIGVLLSLFVPETLTPKQKYMDEADITVTPRAGPRERLSAFFSSLPKKLRSVPGLVVKHHSILVLITVCLIGQVVRQTSNFTVLYASKRFGWTIARASYILSLRSAVTVALVLVVLPGLSHILTTRLRYSGPYKDLVLTHLQLWPLVPGCLTIALAPSPPVFLLGVVIMSLGSASSISARSLALSLVEPTHYAAVNGACSVLQSLGVIMAGPLLAAGWKKGLDLGGLGLGLLFFVAGGAFAVVGLLLATVRMDWRVDDNVEDAAEEDLIT